MRNKKLVFFLITLMSMIFARAQQTTISGTVKADGDPLPGANVIVKGTNNGTTTDFNGKYSIKVDNTDVTLEFSYIGFNSLEIRVNGRFQIDVELEESLSKLDEIVLVGYDTQRKGDLTGAVNSLTNEDIIRTPVISIEKALGGQTPGVFIANRSGDAAAPITVRIRGLGTTGNNQPLFVVDGVPLVQTSNQTVNSSSVTESNPLAAFNPNDIESVSVLKDASAAAIYGSRGANGVILIKTKRGSRGSKTKFTYDAYTSISKRRKAFDVLNTQQYVDIQQEIGNPQFDFEEFRDAPTYDWQDALFRTGYTQNHNLNVTGGGDNSNFSMSLGYLDQKGIALSQGFERVSLTANSDFSIGKFFSFGESISIGFTDRLVASEPGDDSSISAALNAPFAPIFDPDGPFGYSRMDSETVGDLANGINEPIQVAGLNDLRLNETRVKTRRILANVYGSINFSPNLVYTINGGVDFSVGKGSFFQDTYDFGNNDANVIRNNLLVQERPTELTTNISNTLKYSNTFGKHDLSVLLGHEETTFEYDKLRGQGNDLSQPQNIRLVNVSSSSTVGQEADHWALRGYLGRVNYSFDSRYLLTFNVRRDESSRFSKNNRADYFPSVAAGWNITDESFMENSSLFDRLKLRASWGQVGNQFTGNNFAFLPVISFIPAFPVGTNQEVVAAPTSIVFANNDLRWETSEQTNFGIDMTLFNNKLDFTAEYYTKLTKDILVQVPLPAVVGITNPVDVNLGEVSNKGFEFSLNYNDTIGDFSYGISANLSTLKNNVESLDGNSILANAVQLTTSRTIEGQPIGQFFGYKTDGIYQTSEELAGAPDDQIAFNQDGRAPGDIRFVDLNGDGVINEDDRTGIGSPIPTHFYGVTLTAAYKGFDFSIFLQGVGGNSIFNASRARLENLSSVTNKSTSVLNRWTGPGTSNSIPRIDLTSANNNFRFSNRWIESGAYTRIRNIQFGYNFDSDLLARITNNNVSGFRIYAAVQNLAVFTKYKGLDPEVTRAHSFQKGENSLATGIDDGFAIPQPTTFQVGTRISF
jgi:TonB-linked SusC/RagA family outer membrane protein